MNQNHHLDKELTRWKKLTPKQRLSERIEGVLLRTEWREAEIDYQLKEMKC